MTDQLAWTATVKGRAGLGRLAWLPIPILLAAMAGLWVANLPGTYGSDRLIMTLNFIFSTLASALVVYLVSRSFMTRGMPGLLVLGCGVLTWGASGLVAKALNQRDANMDITIHNSCVWLSAMLHFASAILLLRPRRALQVRGLWLGAACIGVLGMLALIALAAVRGYTPTFFVQGAGGTTVRQWVLGSSIAMFLLTAGLLRWANRGPLSAFLYWYTLALGLIALGLFGIMIESVYASLLSWMGLAAQYLSGVYMLIAAMASRRESGFDAITPPPVSPKPIYRYGVAIAMVLAAATLRMVLLPSLGTRVAFITFYPAVMLAALYGGLGAGLLATVLSAAIANYFWMEPGGSFAISDTADVVSLAIFFGSCVMITWLTQAMRRAQAKAAEAEAEARVAAERARGVDALRASERRYSALFANKINGMAHCRIITDAQGRPVDYTILQINEAYERIIGVKKADVEGRRVTEVFPEIRNYAIDYIGMYGKLALEGEEIQFEEFFEASGQYLSIYAYCPVPGEFIAIFTDVTDRKRAEEAAAYRQLQSVIDNTPAVVYALDLEERFLLANAAIAKLLGSTPEQMTGKRRHEFMPKEDADGHEANDRKVVEGGKAMEFEEYSQLKGRSITWLTTKFPLRDAQGKIYAVAGISADVSERKRAEEELKASKISAERARAVAEQASKAKDHFLAVLSHELRNPLNPVLATAAMLQQDPRFDADTREQLEVIRRNAELEARLIDDLLDVTRIERGKVELDRQRIELGAIIQRAVEVCLPDIQARKLEFGVDAPDGPYWVDADAARLQQVFWNLLKNSVKFTPQGGCVGIRCRREGEGTVVVEVNDSGVGMDTEALGRIFNAFVQAERSTTREFGGLGLGLAISRSIVEMHGGSIHARSQGKGKGATFTVRLPLLPAEAAPDLANVPGAAVPGAAASRKLRILLVEDHGDTARIMRRLLSAGGHDVQHAADVASALKLAIAQPFDLLLSDLGLPDGSGVDLMRTLRARGVNLPGIALSGYGQDQDVQQCRDAGFAEHLVKPVNLPKLAETIANLVGDGTAVAGGQTGEFPPSSGRMSVHRGPFAGRSKRMRRNLTRFHRVGR